MFREYRDFELRGRVPRRQIGRGSSYREGFIRDTITELLSKLKVEIEDAGETLRAMTLQT